MSVRCRPLANLMAPLQYGYQYETVRTIQNERTCWICMETFDLTSTSNSRCKPIKLLPCGHIVGKNCFDRWRAHVGGITSCTLCSHSLTPKQESNTLYVRLLRRIASSIWFSSQDDYMADMVPDYHKDHVRILLDRGVRLSHTQMAKAWMYMMHYFFIIYMLVPIIFLAALVLICGLLCLGSYFLSSGLYRLVLKVSIAILTLIMAGLFANLGSFAVVSWLIVQHGNSQAHGRMKK
ncbi:hypothetical protein P154DRAFT_531689 [Amniculicola lignicola CBS 123094]|uniref:RING-type domain-containing protein n=1 Tax=Amniculicola lignicola CBS 123094 TaxID=1392246 RepID=A0A6A5WUW4_9PLEO|nr:hypothetical protein P154DRAFT_531689 [Amniculicola lignicola CBS 123094]